DSDRRFGELGDVCDRGDAATRRSRAARRRRDLPRAFLLAKRLRDYAGAWLSQGVCLRHLDRLHRAHGRRRTTARKPVEVVSKVRVVRRKSARATASRGARARSDFRILVITKTLAST